MARQIEEAIESRRLSPEVEKAGLHPFPHSLEQRGKRTQVAKQLRSYAMRLKEI
jgi:hypothetical protein